MSFISPNTPFVGKGHWTIPTFVIENSHFIDEVVNMGLKLQEELLHSPHINVQDRYRSFKDEVIRTARSNSTRHACAVEAIVKKKWLC